MRLSPFPDQEDQRFLVTDGSGIIFQMHPETLAIEKQTQVYSLRGKEREHVSYLNDMEWIKGYLYINVFTYPLILKVDYSTGRVVHRYDLTLLSREIQGTKFFRNRFNDIREYCLNGIAYNTQTEQLFVTGKKWPVIYQLTLLH